MRARIRRGVRGGAGSGGPPRASGTMTARCSGMAVASAQTHGSASGQTSRRDGAAAEAAARAPPEAEAKTGQNPRGADSRVAQTQTEGSTAESAGRSGCGYQTTPARAERGISGCGLRGVFARRCDGDSPSFPRDAAPICANDRHQRRDASQLGTRATVAAWPGARAPPRSRGQSERGGGSVAALSACLVDGIARLPESAPAVPPRPRPALGDPCAPTAEPTRRWGLPNTEPYATDLHGVRQ